MPFGKCPECERTPLNIKIEAIDASAGIGGPTWKAVNYLCPWCNTILSVGIDPIALKADTVKEVVQQLGKR